MVQIAWITPRTWAVGEVLTAANFNTHIRDNLDAAAGGNKAGCRVFNSVAFGTSNSAAADVTFDSESYDRQACHSTATNTDRITIPTGWSGLWEIGCHINWANNSAGGRRVEIWRNGAGPIAGSEIPASASDDAPKHSVVTTYALVAGDFLKVTVLQSSGGSLNIVRTSDTSPCFWAHWVSA